MSRSYKKNPFITDDYSSKKANKRSANHRVRRLLKEMNEDMPARPQHKKMTCSWDICDYRWRMSRQEAIDWYNNIVENEVVHRYKKYYPTLESWLKNWEKYYRRK